MDIVDSIMTASAAASEAASYLRSQEEGERMLMRDERSFVRA
jgi:heterodisulfide reductase subunit A-like polyferredoxin